MEWHTTRKHRYAETKTVPGAMRQWMKGQADAALATSTPVLYCMEKASEMVQAVEFSAVTTGRASGDYHPPSPNWFLGPVLLFAGQRQFLLLSRCKVWLVGKSMGAAIASKSAPPIEPARIAATLA
jgi:hypothetical protein